jgi:antirestriction protein ArdC
MAKRRLSEAEREERRRRDRERLEAATRELLTSDGWQRWVAVRAENGLSRYSIRNQFLIAMELGRRGVAPRYVAGYRWWAEHGYQVRRGERAIRILAPLRRRVVDETSGEDERRVVGFRAVPVFDLSQVDAGPDAVSVEPPSAAPVTGESHAFHLTAVESLCAELGCTVSYTDIPGDAGGYYRPRSGEIAIEARAPGNARLRTLLHEAAHALVDRELRSDEDGRLPYATEEVLVETIGFVAASAVGLDTSGEAVGYVASWADGDVEQIARMAELVDRGARRLEGAMGVGAEITSHPKDAGLIGSIVGV